jgi:glycosyltransferase involved in cell wall biosynthesis
MSKQKRVLIISTMFPPVVSVGAQRVVGFVKCLPRFGWEPYVLTVRPGPYDVVGSLPKLPRNFTSEHVVRTPFFDLRLAGKKLLLRATGKGVPSTAADVVQGRATGERSGHFLWKLANSLVFVPDPEVGWFPFGVRAGVPMIRESGIDVILSSAPPFTAHLIALRLKQLTGTPWLADFRDPWSQSAHSTVSRWNAIRQPIDRFLERKVMKASDAIISVSQPIVDSFAQLRVRGIGEKLNVITNGYDPEEFADRIQRRPEKLTVTYTGSFYGAVRSPASFFAALADLIKHGKLRSDGVRVKIIERFSQNTARMVAQYNLSDVVSVQTQVPHTEAIQEQVNASVLLLIVGSGTDKMGVYTAKLFEYLAARRPILALAPREGVAAELIREANAGTVVDPDQPEQIKAAILKYYCEHQRTGSIRYFGREEVIRRYEQPVLASKLAEVLDSVTT